MGDCRMNRKRKICKTEIDEERDFIHKSPIYLAGCHDLIGPVSSSKITDLALKILKYSSSRLKTDDFNQLIDSLKSLDAPTLPETPITDNPSSMMITQWMRTNQMIRMSRKKILMIISHWIATNFHNQKLNRLDYESP